MRVDPRHTAASSTVKEDHWLEAQCRIIQQAAVALAESVGEVNDRTDQAKDGSLGRKRRITEAQMRCALEAAGDLKAVQKAVQNALFDCEFELRELRERDVSPAELLVDGERLIRQYRFLRRRARVMDGLLAYLPTVTQHASVCLDHLRALNEDHSLNGMIRTPDCTFALVALEQLSEEG